MGVTGYDVNNSRSLELIAQNGRRIAAALERLVELAEKDMNEQGN